MKPRLAAQLIGIGIFLSGMFTVLFVVPFMTGLLFLTISRTFPELAGWLNKETGILVGVALLFPIALAYSWLDRRYHLLDTLMNCEDDDDQ